MEPCNKVKDIPSLPSGRHESDLAIRGPIVQQDWIALLIFDIIAVASCFVNSAAEQGRIPKVLE